MVQLLNLIQVVRCLEYDSSGFIGNNWTIPNFLYIMYACIIWKREIFSDFAKFNSPENH